MAVAHILTIMLVLMSMGQRVYSRKIFAYMDTLECPDYDANFAERFKCWLELDQNGESMMNVEFKLKKDLTNLKSKYRVIVEQNNRNMTYLSMDINVCEVLGSAMKNPILRLIADELRRKANLPLECPLKEGVAYFMHNFTINSKLIPAFAPRLRWIADSDFYTNTSTTVEKILHFISAGGIDHNKPKKLNPA